MLLLCNCRCFGICVVVSLGESCGLSIISHSFFSLGHWFRSQYCLLCGTFYRPCCFASAYIFRPQRCAWCFSLACAHIFSVQISLLSFIFQVPITIIVYGVCFLAALPLACALIKPLAKHGIYSAFATARIILLCLDMFCFHFFWDPFTFYVL